MMQLLDPFAEILAEQAATLVGIEYPLVLNTAKVGDKDFVPYLPHGTGRTFLLGDVMTEAAARNGLPSPQFPSRVATSLEVAKAVLKKRVGPTPPAWYDENRHRSNEDLQSVAAERKATLPTAPSKAASGSMVGILMQGLIASKQPKKKKEAKRPLKEVSGVLRVQGATLITNIATFSSLGDFLQNALLDEEWLFAIPPRGKGRPYDFLESLLAGDTEVSWKAMTCRDYLRAMLDAAEEDEAILVAEAEASLFEEETSQRNG
jgi:hypothetical protein